MLLSPAAPTPKEAPVIWNAPALGVLGIGAYLATSIVRMTIIGHLLDRKFGTQPALTLVFLALGLAVGFYGAYVQLRDLTQQTPKPPRDGAGR